jgi:hypothetical protein
MPELVNLDLGCSDGTVTEIGWLGLALSPSLGRLRLLYLAGNTINQVSREALVARFGDRVHF